MSQFPKIQFKESSNKSPRKSLVILVDSEKEKKISTLDTCTIQLNSSTPPVSDNEKDYKPNFTKTSFLRGSLRRTGTQNGLRRKTGQMG